MSNIEKKKKNMASGSRKGKCVRDAVKTSKRIE